MTAKLQFGNDEHIKLVQLAKKLDECIVIESEKHDCNCQFCEVMVDHCVSCGKTRVDLFSVINMKDEIMECGDCSAHAVYRCTIYSLKNRLKELEADAKN